MEQVRCFRDTGYADDGNSAPERAFERAIVAVKMQAVDDADATAAPEILECLTLADAYLDDHVTGLCAKMQVCIALDNNVNRIAKHAYELTKSYLKNRTTCPGVRTVGKIAATSAAARCRRTSRRVRSTIQCSAGLHCNLRSDALSLDDVILLAQSRAPSHSRG
jgi:hypothetical protein